MSKDSSLDNSDNCGRNRTVEVRHSSACVWVKWYVALHRILLSVVLLLYLFGDGTTPEISPICMNRPDPMLRLFACSFRLFRTTTQFRYSSTKVHHLVLNLSASVGSRFHVATPQTWLCHTGDARSDQANLLPSRVDTIPHKVTRGG